MLHLPYGDYNRRFGRMVVVLKVVDKRLVARYVEMLQVGDAFATS